MQRSQDMSPELNLREQLLAETSNNSAQSPYPPAPAPAQGPSNPYPQPQSDHSGSPHDPQIDPNVQGGQLQYSMSGGEQIDGVDAKGKRELSTSKRAAQNRAAQRAFRQRKEGYIKKLEVQVKDFQTMEHNYKALQNENYSLREYILGLQSKLLESQAEFPPAPTHANLSSTPSQQYRDSQYEQQAREEQRAPPPAPVVAHEEQDQRHDGINQLHQAAIAQEARSSPYGLASEYPSRQPDSK